MLPNIEGFTHASSLDLHISYYIINLYTGFKQLYTIFIPWGKYEHQKLSIGICNSPNIFQENISKLFKGFNMLCTYLDNILVITKIYFLDHLENLEKVLHKFAEVGLILNTEKSFFGHIENEYLGFWDNKNDAETLLSKVDYIKEIYAPTKVCDVCWFVGIFIYYRDMCRRRENTLSPKTKLWPTKAEFKWSGEKQNNLITMMKIFVRHVLL